VDDRAGVGDQEDVVVLRELGARRLVLLIGGLVGGRVVAEVDGHELSPVETAGPVDLVDHDVVRIARVALVQPGGADLRVPGALVLRVDLADEDLRCGHAGDVRRDARRALVPPTRRAGGGEQEHRDGGEQERSWREATWLTHVRDPPSSGDSAPRLDLGTPSPEAPCRLSVSNNEFPASLLAVETSNRDT